MGNSGRMTKHMDAADLPAYFRALADALEKGGEGEFACVEAFRKFKISGKNVYGKVSLRARFKTDAECRADEALLDGTDGAQPKPDYTTLKKRMRSSFKTLIRMIHDGESPPEQAVESFLDDSALMVTYPGYGDEFYDEYTEACNAFRAAWEADDMERMGETIDVLIHEKSRCHAKYD